MSGYHTLLSTSIKVNVVNHDGNRTGSQQIKPTLDALYNAYKAYHHGVPRLVVPRADDHGWVRAMAKSLNFCRFKSQLVKFASANKVVKSRSLRPSFLQCSF